MILTNIEQACKIMNVSVPGQNAEPGQITFSDDVLKIELCGPSRENLSIIDIPGIFRTPTEGVTTKTDMALVEKMVWDYIRDERTVILAVLPAPTDIATQSILTMAKEADPDGLRTMGVLTKPDLVDKGAEQGVIDLIIGKRHPLRLGYCIVRNRGQAELDTASSERSAVESNFFNQMPWSTLDKDRVGVSALKERLQELLVEITRREFPKLKSQIDQQLAACKGKLAALGPDRTSPEQQRRYLQEMAIEYQKLTDYAVDAYYYRNPVFEEIPALRLPTLIVERNDAYTKEISRRGHTIDFRLSEETAATPESDVSGGSDEEITEDPTDASYILPTWDGDDECSELCNLFPVDFVIPHTQAGNVLKWIEGEYRKARGRGLESIGPAVIPTLWQQQSKNWEAITLHYFRDVITYVHKFICKLLCHVCSNDRTRDSLFSMLIDPLLERYHNAIDHVKFVIKVERFGIPLTQNHYFSDNLQKFRMDRVKKALESAAQVDPTERWVRLERAVTSVPMGNVEHTILDIHAILKSYYKVARKRFVDNVCMQGTDYHLLSSDDSPLRIFSPLFVSSLANEQLESIAGEDPSSKRLRKTLKLEIKALEDGKKLLRTV
jgi:Dynamin central region/Dynamin family